MGLNWQQVLERARRIRVAVFDVDGVLTDGRLWFDDEGRELKAFHVHDGLGMKLLMRHGIQVAVITARRSAALTARLRELGIEHDWQGCESKTGSLEELLDRLGLEPAQAAFTGDELPDLPAMARVGLAVAVANARPEVLERAHWRTRLSGGEGAAREVCDLLLSAQGKMDEILADYQ